VTAAGPRRTPTETGTNHDDNARRHRTRACVRAQPPCASEEPATDTELYASWPPPLVRAGEMALTSRRHRPRRLAAADVSPSSSKKRHADCRRPRQSLSPRRSGAPQSASPARFRHAYARGGTTTSSCADSARPRYPTASPTRSQPVASRRASTPRRSPSASGAERGGPGSIAKKTRCCFAPAWQLHVLGELVVAAARQTRSARSHPTRHRNRVRAGRACLDACPTSVCRRVTSSMHGRCNLLHDDRAIGSDSRAR